jgi:hypothetical protein
MVITAIVGITATVGRWLEEKAVRWGAMATIMTVEGKE